MRVEVAQVGFEHFRRQLEIVGLGIRDERRRLDELVHQVDPRDLHLEYAERRRLAARMERERNEAELRSVDARGHDLAREVRVSGMPPLLVGLHGRDLTRDDPVQAARPQGDHALAPEQPTSGGAFLHGDDDELDRLRQVEVILAGLVRTATPRRGCVRL